jgi:hypothetical protein
MSALDTLADKAQAASERFAKQGGLKAKLADELADDAAFLRKLKPALIRRRIKGQAPTNQKPSEAPKAPSGPQLGAHETHAPGGKNKKHGGGGGPNPFVVIGVALAVGVVTAKILDWRGHAHPRW